MSGGTNRLGTGDFEPVISQINAYDNAQSDTANYMSDFKRCNFSRNVAAHQNPGGSDGVRAMSDANILVLKMVYLQTESLCKGLLEYIYKQYDVQGTEKYKERLVNDIFKLIKSA